MSKCPRVIHVACSDRAGPNVKSDKSLYHEKSGNSERLHLWCDVHKSHTAQAHQLDLQKPVVSGVLNVALSQKPGGTTDKFRQVVKLCMRVRLRVYRDATPPGPESIQWKYRIMLAFWSGLVEIRWACWDHLYLFICRSCGCW